MTLLRGILPAGSNTVPLSDVVAVPVHFGTRHCRPTHPPAPVITGQVLGIGGVPPPQAAPPAHAPQASTPPQPSPIVSQYWPPGGVQVIGMQFGFVHTFAT